MTIYIELFFIFFKLGAFTLGGGYAMIPLVYNEIVEKKNWIKSEDFIDMLAIVQGTPGALAINTAVFVGYKIKGILGLIVTTLGVLIPSVVIIWMIAKFLNNFHSNEYIIKAFKAIRPMISALIIYSAYNLIKNNKVNLFKFLFIILILFLVVYLNFQPILLIILGIVISNIYLAYKGDNDDL